MSPSRPILLLPIPSVWLVASLALGQAAAPPATVDTTPDPVAETAPEPPPPDPAVVEAERRLAERPDSPERLYNLGVALYRAGDRPKAAERFREAATLARSGELAARSMYNEGVAAYADAVETLGRQDPASGGSSNGTAPGSADLNEIITRVETAFTHFRDASLADPDNREARANAENARELIRQLKQAQQQQQQQQNQDQQKQDQQKQDQQKQDQQKQDQQKQDQQKQDQQKQDQRQQDQQKQDQQKQDQQKQDQPPSPASEGDSKPEERPQGELDRKDGPSQTPETPPQASEGKARVMSKEEAERLLQAVRDRERTRRAALAEKVKAQRERTPPARKDW